MASFIVGKWVEGIISGIMDAFRDAVQLSKFYFFLPSTCRTSLFTVAHSEGFTVSPCRSALNYLKELWPCGVVIPFSSPLPSLEYRTEPVIVEAGTGRDDRSRLSARVQQEPVI